MHYPFPDNSNSLWLQKSAVRTFAELTDDVEVDVTIVGGGVAGIVTAYQLKKAGYTVAVVEQNIVGGGTTGGTTGKVSSQHGLVYSSLIRKFGRHTAQVYGASYERAVRDIERIVQDESLACGYSVQDNFVYTTRPQQVETFRQEAADAASLDLPASFESSLELPFTVTAAVKFSNQAYLDAYKFTTQLADRVVDANNFVFEGTKAVRIHEGEPCRVDTEKGSITSKYIVVTTLIPPLPLLARVTYAAYEYPETSYIVATPLKKTMTGMYISPDSDHYSLLPVERDGRRYLLVGGESHIPGLGNAKRRQHKLMDYTHKWFMTEGPSEHAWGAMDYMAYDGLPLVGALYPRSKRLFTISGLKKWGLAGSMVGATGIVSLITNESSEIPRLFTLHRRSAPLSIPEAAMKYIMK